MKLKQVVDTLFSICFGSPWLGHTIKTKCTKLQTVDSKICSILISPKRVWDYAWFPKKILYSINSLDIWQQWKLFLVQFVTSWIFKFSLAFLSSRFPKWRKIQNSNWNISRTKRSFKMKWKAFFIFFFYIITMYIDSLVTNIFKKSK